MTCLEVISVRIAREQDFDDALQLCAEAPLFVEADRFMGLKIYRSEGYGSDLIIHIYRSCTSSGQKKSILGMQLARGLSSYGIVSHSLLMETGRVLSRESSGEH